MYSLLCLVAITLVNCDLLLTPALADDLEASPVSSPQIAPEPENAANKSGNASLEDPLLLLQQSTLTHRDPRVLSFIRDLFSLASSSSLSPVVSPSSNFNQRIQTLHQPQQQQHTTYPEVGKYGEYLQSYPVGAQYQIGTGQGLAAAAAAARPGPLSGYYPGTVESIANPNYASLNPAAAANVASAGGSPWITNPNYNYNYNNAVYGNYNHPQSMLGLGQYGQLGAAGLGLGGLGNLVNTNTNTQDQSSSNSGILKTLMSMLGLSSLGTGSSTTTTNTNSNFVTSTGEFDPTSLLTRIFEMGSSSMESLVTRMNKFDRLKCIPRLICQTIARRQEDAALAALTSTTTTTTTSTRRPRLLSKTNEEPDNARDGRFIKFQGLDTALQQFVNFLDLMQLKEWSLYPLLNGAYQGSQVSRADDCRTKFETCPFSDQQLVYYFNNYNGGFFQSI